MTDKAAQEAPTQTLITALDAITPKQDVFGRIVPGDVLEVADMNMLRDASQRATDCLQTGQVLPAAESPDDQLIARLFAVQRRLRAHPTPSVNSCSFEQWLEPLIKPLAQRLAEIAQCSKTLAAEQQLSAKDWSRIHAACIENGDYAVGIAHIESRMDLNEDGDIVAWESMQGLAVAIHLASGVSWADIEQGGHTGAARFLARSAEKIRSLPTNLKAFNRLAGIVASCLQQLPTGNERDVCTKEWHTFISKWLELPGEVAELSGYDGVLELIGIVLDAAIVDHLLQATDDKTALRLATKSPLLCRALFDVAPDRLVALIKRRWLSKTFLQTEPDTWRHHGLTAALQSGGDQLATRIMPELGFSAGSCACALHVDADADEATILGDFLAKTDIELTAAARQELLPTARLWTCFHTLQHYAASGEKDSSECKGALSQFQRLATDHPDHFAASLHHMIRFADKIEGFVSATVIGAAGAPAIIDALVHCCRPDCDEIVRNRARYYLNVIRGIENPNAALARDLVSFASRLLDGQPFIPHPLSPVSRTWLASADVESVLTQRIGQGLAKFADYFQSQGPHNEEGHVGRMFGDLEYALENAFKNADEVLQLLQAADSQSTPRIEFKYRTVPTKGELAEDKYGCDLAIIVDIQIVNHLIKKNVAIVQVKKAQLTKGVFRDAWLIDIE